MTAHTNRFEPRGQTGNTLDAYHQAGQIADQDLIMWVIPMYHDMAKLIVRHMDNPDGDVVLYLEASIGDVHTILRRLGVDPNATSMFTPIYRTLLESGLDNSDALRTTCALLREQQ